MLHGPLMICGFFGTVISLERAVAIARRWAYFGPFFAGLGSLAAVGGYERFAAALFVLGSAALLLGSARIYAQQRAPFTLCLLAGAACWLAGNLFWLAGGAVPAILPYWIAFLSLTIAGERLELSRVLPPSPRALQLFGLIAALLFGAVLLSSLTQRVGTLLLGGALSGLAIWLLRQDVARRTVRQSGLTRFIAVCLLSGYVWLAFGGVIILASGGLHAGTLSYDAALHAVLLGFVFSMVFGHAPLIFPAVLEAPMPYHPTFYAPLVLLHISLFMRIGGDLSGALPVRVAGGLLNALALLAFVLSVAVSVVRGRLRAGG
jgi:hypothetical protein